MIVIGYDLVSYPSKNSSYAKVTIKREILQGNRIGINKNLIELDIIMGGGT